MTATFERLTTLLIKDRKLDPDRLTPDVPLESLGIDSLGTVELLWMIEDEFRIKLPSEPAPLTTLGDVVRYVDELVAGQASVPSAEVSAEMSAERTAEMPADAALRTR